MGKQLSALREIADATTQLSIRLHYTASRVQQHETRQFIGHRLRLLADQLHEIAIELRDYDYQLNRKL